MDKDFIQVKNLKKYFEIKKGFFNRNPDYVKAVDNISFNINRGETFSLVGESGCGKTTVGRSIIRLYDLTDGEILYDGCDLGKLDDKELFPYRKKMQMIFQDPYACLDPRMTVGEIIGEPIDIHKLYSGSDREYRIRELLKTVGLESEHIHRYPHEFSGGQRQRVGIARALAVEPEFIICDEPISALDVSIQAQIVNMLEDFQRDLGITYLFISHDLSMVKHISHKVGVMYLGNLVEFAPVNELFTNMKHPYTKALLSAVPIPDPDKAAKSKRIPLSGDVPSPLNPPSGCAFRTRCKYSKEICSIKKPTLKKVSDGHMFACHQNF